MAEEVKVGLLVSTEGTYKYIGRSTRAGLLDAIEEINSNSRFSFKLVAHEFNPGGNLEQYVDGANQFSDQGIRHVFGTTTSASRKEIIPDIERRQALLWYPCPYEGYECSENVLYLGGCPNQNLLPLMKYAIEKFGTRGYLIGSNYVWGWESNRIARELLDVSLGEVVNEKYYHFGHTDFDALISDVIDQEASFVLNNLVGDSSYHFLHQLNERCREKGVCIPVLSCNLTESELPSIEGTDHIQLLSCGAFFESVDPDYVARQSHQHGEQPISLFYVCAYVAMYLFAEAYLECGTDDPSVISKALHSRRLDSILGSLGMSEQNNHIALPSYIAEVRNGKFELVHTGERSIPADPYLMRTDFDEFRSIAETYDSGRHLRVVK